MAEKNANGPRVLFRYRVSKNWTPRRTFEVPVRKSEKIICVFRRKIFQVPDDESPERSINARGVKRKRRWFPYSLVYDGNLESNDCAAGLRLAGWLILRCANERTDGRCRRFYKRSPVQKYRQPPPIHGDATGGTKHYFRGAAGPPYMVRAGDPSSRAASRERAQSVRARAALRRRRSRSSGSAARRTAHGRGP